MDKSEVKLPLASYTFKIKECSKEVSKASGNQMLKLSLELVDEPLMEIDGEQVDVNGLEPKPKYISPTAENVSGDPQKPVHEFTQKCLKTVNEFRKALIPPLDPITKDDLANIDTTHFLGRKLVMLASSKTEPMVDQVTKREVVNKLTGKVIMNTNFECGRILTAN